MLVWAFFNPLNSAHRFYLNHLVCVITFMLPKVILLSHGHCILTLYTKFILSTDGDVLRKSSLKFVFYQNHFDCAFFSRLCCSNASDTLLTCVEKKGNLVFFSKTRNEISKLKEQDNAFLIFDCVSQSTPLLELMLRSQDLSH